MSARHAVLGLLQQRPAHPYELGDRLQGRLGPAWAINSGQLSQTIKGLERDGLIEHVARGRGDTKVFAITENGAKELDRWWEEDEAPDIRLLRRSLQLKLALLSGPGQLREALGQIERYERRCAERIKTIFETRDKVPRDGIHVHAEHMVLRLSLSGDVYQLEAELRWARHAHETVSWLLEREAVWPERSARSTRGVKASRDAREELFGRMAARDRNQLRTREDR
jgi:DNA-binding PadR family transcriptional regulator